MDQVSWTESKQVVFLFCFFVFLFFDITNFFIEIQVEGKNNEFTRQDDQQQEQRDNQVSGSAAGDRQTWVCISLPGWSWANFFLGLNFLQNGSSKEQLLPHSTPKIAVGKEHVYSTEPAQFAADPNRWLSRRMRQPSCKIYLLIPLLEPRDLGLHFPSSSPQGWSGGGPDPGPPGLLELSWAPFRGLAMQVLPSKVSWFSPSEVRRVTNLSSELK